MVDISRSKQWNILYKARWLHHLPVRETEEERTNSSKAVTAMTVNGLTHWYQECPTEGRRDTSAASMDTTWAEEGRATERKMTVSQSDSESLHFRDIFQPVSKNVSHCIIHCMCHTTTDHSKLCVMILHTLTIINRFRRSIFTKNNTANEQEFILQCRDTSTILIL